MAMMAGSNGNLSSHRAGGVAAVGVGMGVSGAPDHPAGGDVMMLEA